MKCAKNFYLLLFALHGLCLFTGCTATRSNTNGRKISDATPHHLNLTRSTGGTRQIVFLTMNVNLADSLTDRYECSLAGVTYAEGILKKQARPDDTVYESTALYCEILDADQQPVEFIKVQNPLIKVFEYSDEKTDRLQKMLLRTRSGSVVIRFNFNSQSSYLRLYKTGSTARQLKRIYYARL